MFWYWQRLNYPAILYLGHFGNLPTISKSREQKTREMGLSRRWAVAKPCKCGDQNLHTSDPLLWTSNYEDVRTQYIWPRDLTLNGVRFTRWLLLSLLTFNGVWFKARITTRNSEMGPRCQCGIRPTLVGRLWEMDQDISAVSADMMTYPCWQALRNGPGHFSGRGFQEWKRRDIKICRWGVGVDPQNMLTRFKCPL